MTMNPPNILLVEDERIIALEIRLYLQRLGYAVSACLATGEQALESVTTSCPDLVLMDIMLAGELDGIETARRLKRSCDVPVIYCTAYTDSETLQRVRDTEPAAVLSKPVNMEELREAVGRCLGTKA